MTTSLVVEPQHRVDEELEVVLEQPPEGLEDAAGQLQVVVLVEQVDEARDAHHDADALGRSRLQVGGEPVVLEVVGDQHRHAAGGEQVGAGEEVAPVDVAAAGQQVAHRELGQRQHRLAGDRRVLLELLQRALEHVDVDDVGGRKLPRSTSTACLCSTSDGCSTAPSGPNIAAPRQPELHQLQGHQPVVDAAELDAAELDHVDLDAAGGQPVEQARDDLLGLVMLEERAVQQVDADDAERLLLEGGAPRRACARA